MKGELRVSYKVRATSAQLGGIVVACDVCRCEMPFFQAWRTGSGPWFWKFYCPAHVHLA